MQRDRSIFLAGAAILALGCLGTTTPVAQLPSLSEVTRMGPVIQALAGRIAVVLPLVPLGLALFLFVIPPAPRGNHLHSVLAFLLLLAGLPVVALNALVSGPGAVIALAQGATLVLGPAAALVLFSRIRRGRPVWRGTATDLWFALSVAAALWSVAAGVAAGWQAASRAAGQPYCLARHTSAAAPVTSLADLRGFVFYTTATGYKDSSNWYFHGLLIVDAPSGRQVYNWSPQRLRFDLLGHPDRFIAATLKACEPQARFLRTLAPL